MPDATRRELLIHAEHGGFRPSLLKGWAKFSHRSATKRPWPTPRVENPSHACRQRDNYDPASMCAGGRAGVDQLLGSKIRRLFKAQQLSCNGDLIIGRAMEG